MATSTSTETDERHDRGARSEGDGRPIGVTLLAGAVAAAVLIPILWLCVTALEAGPAAFDLLVRPATLQIALNSALLTAGVTVASIVLAVPLAFLTTRTDLPFRRFWTVVVALPLVIPSYIGAFAFVSAFGPRGRLQSLLAPFGVESLPAIYGLAGTTLVLTLYTYPYVFITARAALLSMDTTLVEAARTLGHARLPAERRITLPQIAPAVAAGALLVALYTLSDFGTPAIMRYDVFTRVIYVEYNAFGQDLAALLSLELLCLTLVILAVESRIRSGRPIYGTSAHRDAVIRLGRWRWPALLLPTAVAALALVVPLGVLGLWFVTATQGAEHAFSVEYVLNSVSVAAAAALVAAVCALPIAYLAAYHRSRVALALERITYLGYAVPGVVLGLALVFFGARYLTPVYQTLPLLVFAYVVRFLPQAVGSTRASFLQVDPALPEAARTLGRDPLRAFRTVTLPLVTPGVLAGAALVFLTTMKELPATLMLRPSGFETLVTAIWRAESAGYFGQAAVPALILVLVSGCSMLVLLAQEGRNGR